MSQSCLSLRSLVTDYKALLVLVSVAPLTMETDENDLYYFVSRGILTLCIVDNPLIDNCE